MKNDPFKIQEGEVKHPKLKEFSQNRSSGDYLDFLGDKNHQSLGKFFDEKKIFILFLVFILFLFILWSRSFYLQIVQGQYFRDIAEGNRTRDEIILANRGLIYDRFGNLLVKNISQFFLYLAPTELEGELANSQLINKLTDILEIAAPEILARIDEANDGERVLIYENVPYEQAIELMLLSENYPSLTVNYEPRREYFSYLGMAHALGYLGVVDQTDLAGGNYSHNERIGKTGLEFIYENTLRGRNGYQRVEVDALNQTKNIIAQSKPKDGSDLILTVDAKSQAKLYQVMSNNSAIYNKRSMAGIVLDAKDGGILAMVSLPIYDNNIFTSFLNKEDYNTLITDPATPLLNRNISGTYPFGSVFKPIVAAAALEENLIDVNFTVRSTGGIQIGNNWFPDWRPSGHGLTNIIWAIADSVNTFFYTIGGGNNQWLELGLGADKIIAYAKKFGLGQPTGVDLNSEVSGFLPSKDWKQSELGERWFLGDTYNLSIGQGYLLGTPMQAAVMMSYFATGQSYQPHFIKEIKNEEQIENYKPQVILENVISQENLNLIRRGLRETVRSGTAKSLQSVDASVAGKTGTAQFNRNKSPHSWFASFAPYDDPEIVVVVLVEEGGDKDVSIIIARQFMEWYFDR